MEFKVKRDFLPIFIINLVLAFILIVPTVVFMNWIGYLLIFDVIILTIIILYNTSVIFASCKIENNTLTYKAGAFKYVIGLNEIIKTSIEKNLHFSLALSMDRIRILTKNNEGKQKIYYISTCDNEKLISLLKPAKTVEDKKEVKVENVEEKPEVVEVKETAPAKKSTTTKKATTTKKSTTTKKTTPAKKPTATTKTTKKSTK